jgi:hypothetical protein
VKYIIFDKAELILEKISLRKRYTGISSNLSIARIFGLLSLNRQFRFDILGYIYYKSPTFTLLIQVAHTFPLLTFVRRLELREIEFDLGSIYRPKNYNYNYLPTRGTEDVIKKFGSCWTDYYIEELILIYLIDL